MNQKIELSIDVKNVKRLILGIKPTPTKWKAVGAGIGILTGSIASILDEREKRNIDQKRKTSALWQSHKWKVITIPTCVIVGVTIAILIDQEEQQKTI